MYGMTNYTFSILACYRLHLGICVGLCNDLGIAERRCTKMAGSHTGAGNLI